MWIGEDVVLETRVNGVGGPAYIASELMALSEDTVTIGGEGLARLDVMSAS